MGDGMGGYDREHGYTGFRLYVNYNGSVWYVIDIHPVEGEDHQFTIFVQGIHAVAVHHGEGVGARAQSEWRNHHYKYER